MAAINIRKAERTDARKIFQIMQQQAIEQKVVLLPHMTAEAVEEGGWGKAAVFQVFVVERQGEEGGMLEGYILAHHAYSTWCGRAVFIKELFVTPAFRHKGVATQLCRRVVQAALEEGCVRCDLKVRKMNKEAVSLCGKLQAGNLTEAEEWHFFKMDKTAMSLLQARCGNIMGIEVRRAGAKDMAGVRAMVQELADYENMPQGPKIDAQTLVTDSSSSSPFFEAYVVESNGALTGYVLLYHTFSLEGRGIYMEDLYVKPSHRRQGLGTALMGKVAERGLTMGASCLEFSVLAWNTPSIAFYEHKGATDTTASQGHHLYRLGQCRMKELKC